MCNCETCDRHRREYAAIEARDVDGLASIIEELETALECAETEIEYLKGVMSGRYIDEVPMLREAIAKAEADIEQDLEALRASR